MLVEKERCGVIRDVKTANASLVQPIDPNAAEIS